jgi:hypothetical protein
MALVKLSQQLYAPGRPLPAQKVGRSMQAATEGRVHSHEEVKTRLSKWLLR